MWRRRPGQPETTPNPWIGVAALVVTLLLGTVTEAQHRGGRDRLAPPAALNCDRNHLTSYEGRLQALTPAPDELTVTLVTDWDSEETFTVPANAVQLRDGTPMDPPAQAAFLAALKPPTTAPRLIAWVCAEPSSVTLDWRPAVDVGGGGIATL
jgi:hypothetical protein